ncbi:YceI family protein [Corallococcus interemptor]|uniref:YceI family protein n=1 Tax=Corallococcus TaxID=83461 RepID=UPI001CBA9EAD|nr:MULTISPECIES: YceI family protein [unclassified Corallococcus]MBZ4333208.1 YceI family protein [Corallococcus sp. AS-1-12]MBZ4373448.1 YceI family protein [Corallococcus sp. AS-1-6]
MFRSVLMLAATLSLSASAAEPAPADKQFVFHDPNSRDTVMFVLDAPLEVINGLSNQVTGRVDVKGQKASGRFQVPVKSIKTGNETRDGHLQNDRWLDAAKHPDIVFEFKDVALPAPLANAKPVVLKTKGTFTIHGVTREEPVEVTATYLQETAETKNRAAGELLRVRAKFQIPLEAYGIKRTEALLLKVGERADVTVDAWGSTQFKP